MFKMLLKRICLALSIFLICILLLFGCSLLTSADGDFKTTVTEYVGGNHGVDRHDYAYVISKPQRTDILCKYGGIGGIEKVTVKDVSKDGKSIVVGLKNTYYVDGDDNTEPLNTFSLNEGETIKLISSDKNLTGINIKIEWLDVGSTSVNKIN